MLLSILNHNHFLFDSPLKLSLKNNNITLSMEVIDNFWNPIWNHHLLLGSIRGNNDIMVFLEFVPTYFCPWSLLHFRFSRFLTPFHIMFSKEIRILIIHYWKNMEDFLGFFLNFSNVMFLNLKCYFFQDDFLQVYLYILDHFYSLSFLLGHSVEFMFLKI